MDLGFLIRMVEYTKPWVESLVIFLMFIFFVFIIAKLLHNIANKTLFYFDTKKYKFIPDVVEYGTYILGFIFALIYAGIFKFALIVFLGMIFLLFIISLASFIFQMIPNFLARNKLINKNLVCNYGKKYSVGIFNTTYYFSAEEKIIIPNKELLHNFNRGLC